MTKRKQYFPDTNIQDVPMSWQRLCEVIKTCTSSWTKIRSWKIRGRHTVLPWGKEIQLIHCCWGTSVFFLELIPIILPILQSSLPLLIITTTTTTVAHKLIWVHESHSGCCVHYMNVSISYSNASMWQFILWNVCRYLGNYSWCPTAHSCTYFGTHEDALFELLDRTVPSSSKQGHCLLGFHPQCLSALLVFISAHTRYCLGFSL